MLVGIPVRSRTETSEPKLELKDLLLWQYSDCYISDGKMVLERNLWGKYFVSEGSGIIVKFRDIFKNY